MLKFDCMGNAANIKNEVAANNNEESVNNNEDAVNKTGVASNKYLGTSDFVDIKTEPQEDYDTSYNVHQSFKIENSFAQMEEFPVKLEPLESEVNLEPSSENMRWKVKVELDIDEDIDEAEVKEEVDIDEDEAEVLAATENYVEYGDATSWYQEGIDEDRSVPEWSPGFMDSEFVDDPDYDEHVLTTVDLPLVKQENEELQQNDLENNVVVPSQPCRIIKLGGFKVECNGDYSKCPKCEKNIKSTYIIRHIKFHEEPVIKCPIADCEVSSTRSTNIYRHLKNVHKDDKPYFCVHNNCLKKFEDSRHLREHVEQVHRRQANEADLAEPKKTYKCEFPGCPKEYGKRQYLVEHFRKHTGEKRYACEVCGERFFIHAHMKRHLYRHTGIKSLPCRWECGAQFATYGGRMKHERTQHSENPYKLNCDICARPFRFSVELDRHKLTHLSYFERKAYRCSYCNIVFESIKQREKHEVRHQDADSFKCEDCNKVFKNERNLQHHFQAVHQQDKKKKKEPPKFPCHLCDSPILYRTIALRRHLARKHSTNYKCTKDGCGKTFEKEYQFHAHVKLHLNRSCHICEKQFKRKQNADIHLTGVHGLTKEDLVGLGR